MAANTKIEWTDATWNPITGCSIVSPGCTNCYAMRLAGTRMKNEPSRTGLTTPSKAGPVWNGQVRFNEQWLTQPLHWAKPRMVFVCAHADLFHESVPDEWLDKIFAVMALAQRHTFQVLTKRPERMRDYLQNMEDCYHGNSALFADRWGAAAADVAASPCAASAIEDRPFPLPNVWIGVSVEDQRRADERIPILLDTPAAVRWISAEPLLGPLDLTSIDVNGDGYIDALNVHFWGEHIEEWRGTEKNWENSFLEWFDISEMPDPEDEILPRLDWVVAGGESGPKARPMHPDWARSLRDQCAAAGVPFLFKQWGEWLPWGQKMASGHLNYLSFGKKEERYSHLDGGKITSKVGKKNAGRLLDGIEHNGFPVRPV